MKLVKTRETPLISNNVAHLLIVYQLNRWSKDFNPECFAKDGWFGNVKINKNSDPDKHSYSQY